MLIIAKGGFVCLSAFVNNVVATVNEESSDSTVMTAIKKKTAKQAKARLSTRLFLVWLAFPSIY